MLHASVEVELVDRTRRRWSERRRYWKAWKLSLVETQEKTTVRVTRRVQAGVGTSEKEIFVKKKDAE